MIKHHVSIRNVPTGVGQELPETIQQLPEQITVIYIYIYLSGSKYK